MNDLVVQIHHKREEKKGGGGKSKRIQERLDRKAETKWK